jgi:hypothetical protein
MELYLRWLRWLAQNERETPTRTYRSVSFSAPAKNTQPVNSLGVFAHQRFLSSGNLQPIKVMPSLIPVIQPDVDDIRIALRHLVYHHPHSLQTRQIAIGRCVHSRGGFHRRIYCIDIEVLISVVILGSKEG